MLMLCLTCFHRYRDSQRAQREKVLSYARVSKPPRSEQESDSGVCQGTLLWVSPHITACVKCLKVNEFSQKREVTNQVVYLCFFKLYVGDHQTPRLQPGQVFVPLHRWEVRILQQRSRHLLGGFSQTQLSTESTYAWLCSQMWKEKGQS